MDKKCVLITGAAKGIGKAVALEFAKNGYNIALNYRSGEPIELIEEIEALGAQCLAVRADVGISEQAEETVSLVKNCFGKIDALVNNAGITRDNLLIRMSEQDFDDVIRTNLKGAFNMIRQVTPLMLKARGGAIVNMSSVVGIMGNAGQANYAASKAGLIGLTKSTAKELASRGITCNAIAPGFIETDMTSALPDEVKQKMLESIPLRRFGSAEDVAKLVFFIANAGYITGQVIHVDGGMA